MNLLTGYIYLILAIITISYRYNVENFNSTVFGTESESMDH